MSITFIINKENFLEIIIFIKFKFQSIHHYFLTISIVVFFYFIKISHSILVPKKRLHYLVMILIPFIFIWCYFQRLTKFKERIVSVVYFLNFLGYLVLSVCSYERVIYIIIFKIIFLFIPFNQIV